MSPDVAAIYGINDYSAPMSRVDAPFTPLPGDFYKTNEPVGQQPSVFVSPDDQVKFNTTSTATDPNNRVVEAKPAAGTIKPRNSDIDSGGVAGGGSTPKPKYTEDQVMFFGRSASYLVGAASDFANAWLATGNAEIEKGGYDFRAQQDERMASILEKNIRDINLAAQLDANQYKISGASTKAKQTVAMAGSGFAVGKGSYRSTLATTDARTNYNIAMRMLKADLQTAETIRKVGTYRARAEIERGNAKIAEIKGDSAMWSGIINGVGNIINSGFSFYVGKWGLEGASGKTTETTSGGKQ